MSSKKMVVIGCSGAIGKALLLQLSTQFPDHTLYGFSSQIQHGLPSNCKLHTIDYESEDSIEKAASICGDGKDIDRVIVASGLLHYDEVMPEKSIQALSAKNFHMLFSANTIFPALVAKHFLPKLSVDRPSIFAVLSARVGSISDNRLGGWYAYRASKAALNMILKTAAIEFKRHNKKAVIVGLHPGTVDTPLSKPFQANVRPEKLFLPSKAAHYLMDVMSRLKPSDSGKCFAWDGQEILP